MPYFDFFHFYAAGVQLWSGQSPYEMEGFRHAMYQLGWPLDKAIPGMPYPPWTCYIYYLLAIVPFEWSAALWTLVSGYVFFLLCPGRVHAHSQATSRWQAVLESGMFLVLFFPVLKHLYFGQLTVLILFGILVYSKLYQSQWYAWSGVFLSLSLIKPHLTLIVLVALLIQFVRDRKFSAILGFGVGAALQGLASFIINPGIYLSWWQHLHQFVPVLQLGTQPTLPQLIAWSSSSTGMFYVTMFVGLSLGIWIALTRAINQGELFVYLLPVTVLFAPYAWEHDFVLLAPLYLILCGRLRNLAGITPTISLLALTFAMNVYLFVPGRFLGYVWIPLILLLGTRYLRTSNHQTS